MIYQYMIWQNDKGKTDHLAFHQKSRRIVYPPSHPFFRSEIALAIMTYEQRGWRLVDTGTWRGEMLNEYLQAMHKMHPKALQKKAEDSGS